MAFDGITTKSISYELQYSILGGKINKIFEPNKNEVLLSIYANGKNYALNICIDSNLYRIHLTTNAKPNPLNAPNFCMLLRKHLIGYKIKAISSNDNLERIIKIELEGYNELNDLTTKYLMVELMGKHSNIILLNNKFFIIDSLRHLDTLSNSYRDILPAHEYTYPENVKNNFYTIKSAEEFCNLVLTNNVTNLTNFLVGYFTGFSKPFIKNIIIKQNNINKEIKSRVNYINDIDIGTAVQASCSYPGIFSPCPFNNKLFVDGGITENLPWKETKKAGANKVLSIVFEDKEPKKCCNNIFEIINKSFSLLCKELARYELDGTDYLLKIKTNRVGLLEKSKMQELYEEGYIQTKKMLQNNILKN